MSGEDSLVARSARAGIRETFDQRVRSQADQLVAACDRQAFDSPSFGVGLELEVYAVDEAGRLAHVPDPVFETACEKELGKHNAELQTTPTELNAEGLAAQREQLEGQFDAAARAAAATDREIVLDAMWTIPPAGGTMTYLTDVDADGRARNMASSPRYTAIDRQIIAEAGGSVPIELPGVSASFPSILVESLATSMQPHLQVPTVEAYPTYHNAAIRTLGPILALGTNSPFLPVDLYEVDDPIALVDRLPHESRVHVFEQSINAAWEKVKFPQDVSTVTDVIERLVADPTCGPFLREWLHDDAPTDAFADRFWEFDHKRGTYWRWLRAVIGGEPVGAGNDCSIRIEYRPLPTQPSITDTVGLQAVVAGLIRGIVTSDHPVMELPHADARRCFYAVVDQGMDATFAWIDADGASTSHPDTIYRELFELARRGLTEAGVTESQIDALVEPIEARWERGLTPSKWKRDRVRSRLEEGASLRAAVTGMQRTYIERAGSGEPLAAWER